MEKEAAASLFAVLGHPGRLSVLSLVMRHAPQGVRPTEMAARLALKPNTLSHHLADLEQAGLIWSQRQGRSILYGARVDRVAALIGYLFADCGRARADLLAPALQDAPWREAPLPDRPLRVLFVCTGNTARSILAEALLRDLGQGRFVAFSGGTAPKAAPHPGALAVLARQGHATEDLACTALETYQAAGAATMDFVFTLCDTAAHEACQPWPGQPVSAHWGLPDPAAVTGSPAEQALAFAQTYAALRRRIAAFVALPLRDLDRMSLQMQVDRIGLETQTEEGQ